MSRGAPLCAWQLQTTPITKYILTPQQTRIPTSNCAQIVGGDFNLNNWSNNSIPIPQSFLITPSKWPTQYMIQFIIWYTVISSNRLILHLRTFPTAYFLCQQENPWVKNFATFTCRHHRELIILTYRPITIIFSLKWTF